MTGSRRTAVETLRRVEALAWASRHAAPDRRAHVGVLLAQAETEALALPDDAIQEPVTAAPLDGDAVRLLVELRGKTAPQILRALRTTLRRLEALCAGETAAAQLAVWRGFKGSLAQGALPPALKEPILLHVARRVAALAAAPDLAANAADGGGLQ